MLDARTVREITRECREAASEMTKEDYRLYDAIWWDRIHIDSALLDHGKDTVRTINRLMPNLLTHDARISPVDVVAERYGFASTSALVEYLLAYTPRGPVQERYFERLFAARLEEAQAASVPDNPF